MKNGKPEFDDLIIGSSPLMLLQALELAQTGRKVCVLAREEKPGGAWRSILAGSDVETEIACHVIEVFPKVYDVLEKASGCKFEKLDLQPIRVHSSGFQMAYFNRVVLAASGLRMLLQFLKLRTQKLISVPTDENALINYRTKFMNFLKYQTRCLVVAPIVKGPACGFVEFINSLAQHCTEEGVQFKQFDVGALERRDGAWAIRSKTPDQIESIDGTNVYITTSTNLHKVRDGQFETTPINFANHVAILIEIDRDVVEKNHTYVAFWKDPSVTRISRVDKAQGHEDTVQFLIEFRQKILDKPDDGRELIAEKLFKCGIIRADEHFSILAKIDCVSTRNSDQLPSGRIDEGIYGLHSSGNLAAGVAAWLAQKD